MPHNLLQWLWWLYFVVGAAGGVLFVLSRLPKAIEAARFIVWVWRRT